MMHTQKKISLTAQILNVLLLVSFAVTLLVPLTGVIVHKMASAIFLLLCVVHTIAYRKRLKWKGAAMLGLVLLAFLSGLFGMIWDQAPFILTLHKVISIGCVLVLAIHIFVWRRRLA